MLEVILQHRDAFIRGLVVTLELASIAWLSGLLLGSILGVAGARWHKSVGVVTRTFSFVLSGIPILVLLFWLHYPAQALLGIVIDPFYTSALVLSLVNIFVVEQIVRSAVQSLPGEFRQAGIVCGLSNLTVVLRIEMPLLARHVLGPLLGSQVVALHMTLFASLISVEELLRMAQRVNAQIYKPVEIYSALGLFFLLVSLPVNGLALVLRRRFSRNLSER